MCLAAPGDFRRVDDVVEVALLNEFTELLDLFPEMLNLIEDSLPLRIIVLGGRGGLLCFSTSRLFPVLFDLILLIVSEGLCFAASTR